MMADHKEVVLRDLLEQIGHYSQPSVAILEKMRQACSQASTYYAAFLVVHLYEQLEDESVRPFYGANSPDLCAFEHFEAAVTDAQARQFFDELMTLYKEHLAGRNPNLEW
jgi:hypothetical protein